MIFSCSFCQPKYQTKKNNNPKANPIFTAKMTGSSCIIASGVMSHIRLIQNNNNGHASQMNLKDNDYKDMVA